MESGLEDSGRRANLAEPSGMGLLRLPNELLLEVLQQLDGNDWGILAISTSCKRLHYLALPIYLAAYGITDTASLATEALTLLPPQLDVLIALQTCLFVRSLKHISCSFSLNSARRDYSSRDMDRFFRHLRRLAAFISILNSVDEVTLNFEDVNLWAISESLGVLEIWASVISTLLDTILEKQCKIFNVVGGMFIVHPSQFQRKGPRATVKRRTIISDVGRRIGSAFAGKTVPPASDSGKSPAGLQAFNIHSRVLLLHPCYDWTIAALSTSPNLTSLSIVHVEIPDSNWDNIMFNIHAPALQDLTIDLHCRISAAAFDQLFIRHPRLRFLSLGRNLHSLAESDVASKDCLPNLTTLSGPPSYIRFLMTERRAPAVQTLRLLVKVASNAVFKVADINSELAPCHSRLGRINFALVITVDYESSHWTGFFPDEESLAPARKGATPDSLQRVRALDLISRCPGHAFEELAFRWLPSFPVLQSVSFSGCSTSHMDVISFVHRVKDVCPEIQLVTLDGKTYADETLTPM
ncbi:hypothetical protein C8R43DRAFT_989543 [Mycena crocata]|nr:hypothetical protein C8R43DRAFT_989543 [Mycena crocata]